MLNRIVHLFIFIASTIVVALSNESWQALTDRSEPQLMEGISEIWPIDRV